ncbi:MAG: Unknown protein [uncultured Sulfurovum sp.]|uniref:Type II toxin-antitoxin system antitoxin, RelB/DinJ family n=1 Tax=uncultured Sulfurovum sp. TaxID=269237 RepID=A0A6S6ST53_9BACT|nr:MAG: Unknown protein [uncultured Sulfurovum sp.]
MEFLNLNLSREFYLYYIRVDEVNYNLAKDILAKLGLNYSQAISVFNNMVVMNQGLPFDVKIPTKETEKALKM